MSFPVALRRSSEPNDRSADTYRSVAAEFALRPLSQLSPLAVFPPLLQENGLQDLFTALKGRWPPPLRISPTPSISSENLQARFYDGQLVIGPDFLPKEPRSLARMWTSCGSSLSRSSRSSGWVPKTTGAESHHTMRYDSRFESG